jgi:hypothetical protein
MIDTTCDQINDWRWATTPAFGHHVDRYNLHATSLGKITPTGERFSWYGSDDPRATIEPPSCQQYTPGDLLAIRPLNWDEIIDKDDDDDNRADPGAPSDGRSRPTDGNDNDDSEGEEDTQSGEKGTGKGKVSKNWKAKGKGMATEEGMRKGKGTVK